MSLEQENPRIDERKDSQSNIRDVRESGADTQHFAHGIPYELRLGVTGHCELPNPGEVRGAVKELLDQLLPTFTQASRHPRGPHGSQQTLVKKLDGRLTCLLALLSRALCPLVNVVLKLFSLPTWPVVPVSTSRPVKERQTPLKLTVISSLAAGSDQIVTEVVRDLLHNPTDPGLVRAARRNRYVEAVLPMPVEQYEATFSNLEELATFQDLLQLDRGRFATTPHPTIVCASRPSDAVNDSQDRHAACAAAGRYVMDSSEIVLAIWDPDRVETADGTGETVRYALDQGKLIVWLNPSQLPQGPRVLQLARKGDTEDEAASSVSAPAGMVTRPLSQRAKKLSSHFHQLAAFNRDNAVSPEELQMAIASESAEFAKRASGKLPDKVIQTIATHVLPHVVRADQLSHRYQALRGVALRLWPTLAAFAVTLMAFQILFLPSLYWLAWIELALLLICAIAYRVSLHEAWHDKWRNDRRLAEGLRGALFRSLVMVDDEPVAAQSRYATCGGIQSQVENPLPFYSATQSWFIGTLKRIALQERRRFAATIDWTRDLSGIKQFLAKEWIQRQADYHAENADRHDRKVSRNTICRLVMIGLIILVAIVHAFGIGHDDHHHAEVSTFVRVDLWIAWATVALPAWAAALHAMASAEDHERLAKRSTRMVPLLNGLVDRVGRVESRSELEACVDEVEALLGLENQEWSESLSERKPEFTG